MKILIRSRRSIEKMAKEPFPVNTALISIADEGDEFAVLDNTPAYLLQISFNDVDNDVFIDEVGEIPKGKEKERIEKKYHMINDELALKMARFYLSNEENIETMICQCEHGQSRSAAVAAAIMEYRGEKGIRVFAHDNYFPNKVVFRKVYEALKNESKKG